MRLWRRNEAPVGGWFFIMESGRRVPKTGVAVGLDNLVDMAAQTYEGLSLPVPDHLFELVEDQICQRQPEGRCRYSKKLGDVISASIGVVAGVADSLLGTTLKQSARRCGKCGQRRVKLNNL